MRPRQAALLLLALFLLTSSFLLVPQASGVKRTDTLTEGNFHRFDVSNMTDYSNHLRVKVDASDGKPFDVYIMIETEYEYY